MNGFEAFRVADWLDHGVVKRFVAPKGGDDGRDSPRRNSSWNTVVAISLVAAAAASIVSIPAYASRSSFQWNIPLDHGSRTLRSKTPGEIPPGYWRGLMREMDGWKHLADLPGTDDTEPLI